MNPFLKTNDEIISISSHPPFEVGSCYLYNGLVHRAIDSNNLKGDRLIYIDPIIKDEKVFKIIGRVTNKQPLTFSNYDHFILKTISKLIAKFSKYNIEKNIARYIVLTSLILLAYIHRRLETIFTIKES